MAINTKKFIEEYLKIRDKNGKIVPFILNKPQMKLYDALTAQHRAGKPKRIIILKARQMGFSTLGMAIVFKYIATHSNVTGAIVAHKDDATANLYEMFQRYYDNLPNALKPSKLKGNAKELVFGEKEGGGLCSKIKCYTAEGTGIGRSDTLNALHISELAFFRNPQETLLGLMQALSDSPQSICIIESTANGYDYFKEMYDRAVAGESDFFPIFCAWHELDEYRKDATGIVLTPEEVEIKERYNLDNEQIAWRRYTIANKCGGDVNLFKQEYPACPEEAFLSTGDCFFDKELIIKRLDEIRAIKPLRQGKFDYEFITHDRDSAEIRNAEFVASERGWITIHAEPEIRKDSYGNILAKKPYAIGGDVAGEGSDYYTAKVVDVITNKTVATLRVQKTYDDLYAHQLYCLGKYYNDAIIGVEVNFNTIATVELERLSYPNLYIRERFDSIDKTLQKKHGFQTNISTRKNILSNLKNLHRIDYSIECDAETLREMLYFIVSENGKPQAMEGKHDDLVMALAIAHQVATQSLAVWEETGYKEVNEFNRFFSLDDNDDEYASADEAGGYMEW